MPDEDFNSGDFHNVAHKHIANAVFETLAQAKLDWALVVPFLEAARALCRSDFQQGAQVRFHSLRAEGEDWVESEEAFLGIAVPDRDTGEEWLSETYWLSDIALADPDPAQVRRTVAAIERSLDKVKTWLAEQEKTGSGESA